MLRVGIDTRYLNIAKTGVRTYLEEIVAALPRVAPQHQWIPLQPSRRMNRGLDAFGKIGEHLRNFLLWKQVELPRLARQNRCDLIFCTDFTAPLSAASWSVPVFHDANFWVNPEHYNRFWRMLLQLFTLPAARRAPAVVTVSEFSRQEVARYTRIRFDRIAVVPNGPKNSTQVWLQPDALRQILAKHKLDPETPFALHVGVREKRKNLPRLVEAFAIFSEKVSRPYHLVLVGQPGPKIDLDDTAAILTAIQRFSLQDRVFLTGHTSDEDLPAFYQGASMFVFPTLREGFGIPVLEAFISHLPVATSNATSIPEVAGDAALLFDPYKPKEMADAMLRLACDESLRQDLIRRGAEQAARFSWDLTATRLVDLFEQISY